MNAPVNAPSLPKPLSKAEINEYLAYALEQMISRRDQLVKALLASAAAYPRIDDDEVLGEVSENMRMAGTLVRTTAKARHTEHKAPFLDGGRVVDAWFKTWAAPLEAAMAPIQQAMNAYGARKLAAAEAAAAEAKRLADAAQARAQQEAEGALRRGRPDVADSALDRVAEAAKTSEAADKLASARPADLTRSYGTFGAVASAKRTWKWRVTDIALVPRDFLMINEDAIKAVAKQRDASGKPTYIVPGVEWFSEVSMGVR